MKIKTITCHDVYNYGASLQAYALQSFLQRQGHTVEIIDYLPDYRKKRYDFLTLWSKNRLLQRITSYLPFLKPIVAIIKNRKKIYHYYKDGFYLRKHAFDNFKSSHLTTTPVCYRSLNQLTENKPEADLYIAGSDQIWNTNHCLNGSDGAFYCTFEPRSNKCISYAASFGCDFVSSESLGIVKEGLKHLRAISVRESSGVKIVEDLGYKACEVLDPVFLLEKRDWESLCKVRRDGDYLLVYDFLHNDPNLKKAALDISKMKKLKIISINDFREIDYADKNVNDAGPIEFLEYVRGAKFVISSSFHATAFSVIFQKEFLTFPLVGHGNFSRMRDFLDGLDMSERFINEATEPSLTPIDYGKVQVRLEEKKKESTKWIANNLK